MSSPPYRAATRFRELRLLPPGHQLGWTPYLWLVYLSFFLVEPVIRLRLDAMTAGHALATVLALLIFLASYFRGFWVGGRDLLVVVAVQCLLGVALAPFNTGASVFLIYAGSFAGTLDPSRTAARVIVAISAVGAVTSWLTQAPPWYWLPAVAMPLIIGFVNLHDAQIQRANAKLRLAQEQIVHLATVAERERIARDLHDLLGHTLSLIVLKSELAGKLLTRDPARAAAEVRDVEQVARAALQEVREAIRGYRPSLAEEIERSRSLLRAAGIRAELRIDPVEPAGAAEEALALALREAVTNVVRHSGAALCRIRLHAEADRYLLAVEDDGSAGDASEGSGLRGMRERVEALGGRVVRGRSAAGRGFRLEVGVPLVRETSGAASRPPRPAATA